MKRALTSLSAPVHKVFYFEDHTPPHTGYAAHKVLRVHMTHIFRANSSLLNIYRSLYRALRMCSWCIGSWCIGYLYFSASDALANIPAAYLACEGAPEGSACSLPGPQFGVCVRDTLCVDSEITAVDECVLCVDGCWADVDGASCVRPWSGEEGVCETQDRCTDRIETSFEECRRCVRLPEPEPDDLGLTGERAPMDTRAHGCDQSYFSSSSYAYRAVGQSRENRINVRALFIWFITCVALCREVIRRQARRDDTERLHTP